MTARRARPAGRAAARLRAGRRAGGTLPDPVRLALHQGWFAACAEEMGATLMRTAHSPNITERLDFSCAIFDWAGRLVSQAAHIPVHLGSMPRAVEAALTLAPLRRGDAVILNDPFAGGTHLPDLTIVSPVFLGAGRIPEFLVASRAHHADVGGAAPGSMPLAREVYEEGLRLPPVFIARRGRLERDVMRLVLANVRTPDERFADLMAQLGAQATGARRLAALAARDGRAALVRAADRLMDHAERCVRAAIRDLPRGRFTFQDALDDDGLGSGPLPIAVTLTLDGRRIRVDFTGSSPQAQGPVNAVEAVTRAATAYAARCVLGGEIPVNDGAFRPLEIMAPLGSIVNPRPPAAVAAGNVETSQRIVDTVLGAFAQALPDRIPAASSGTMNNLLIGGVDTRSERLTWGSANVAREPSRETRSAPPSMAPPRYTVGASAPASRASRESRGTAPGPRSPNAPRGAERVSWDGSPPLFAEPSVRGGAVPFAYYETLAGGHGAGPSWNGAAAMQAHMTNTRNTPIESLEHAYPFRVVATRIRRGSGGAGRWRGGDGIERVVELLTPARVTVISERRARGPYGLGGGEDGAPGENRVRPSPGVPEAVLPGKFQVDLPAGAVLTVASPGGGGFGQAGQNADAQVGRRAAKRGRSRRATAT